VLGGDNQAPVDGVVLGGIEGVKRRLANPVADIRAIAITQAENYGKEGLDLIIEALNDVSGNVRGVAYETLQQKLKEPFMQGSKTRVRKELANFDILKIFTTLDDWVIQDFNPDIGIIDTSSIAYNVKSLEELKTLLNSPIISEIQALSLDIEPDKIKLAIDILLNKCNNFSSLRALLINENAAVKICHKGDIDIGEILNLYPYLNLLQLQGVRNIKFSQVQHESLKTLILNTCWLKSIDVKEIDYFRTPNLDYFYWFANGAIEKEALDYLFSSICLRQLKYLAWKISCNYDSVISSLLNNKVIHNLIGLDLSNGHLTDRGAYNLFMSSAIKNLQFLNVSKNYLSPEMVKKLSKLKCKVIANSQYYSR
jgi:hypothetical protein